MSAIPMLFIVLFILVNCLLGVGLLYRGYTLLLERFEMESITNLTDQLMLQLRTLGALVSWKRAALFFVLLAPGSIPVLLLVAAWRALRNAEPGNRLSARSLKAAIQNIAL